MLLAGVGLTRIPTFLVGQDIAAGRLKALLTDYEMFEAAMYVVYPEREFLSPKVVAFIDFITEEVTEHPPWDEFRKIAVL